MDCCRLLSETILERILSVTFDCLQHVWIQHLSQSHTHIHCCPRHGWRLQQVGAWTLGASGCFCLSLSSRGRLVQNVHACHRTYMLHPWLGTCRGDGHLCCTRSRISFLLTSLPSGFDLDLYDIFLNPFLCDFLVGSCAYDASTWVSLDSSTFSWWLLQLHIFAWAPNNL